MPIYAENRKARFNYEFSEKYEAGIELLGLEVKAIRTGRLSLEGAFVLIRGGEAYLINATIAPYQAENTPKDYDSMLNRRLLLTKEEIKKLLGSEKNKSLTIVPVSVYNKGKKLKVEIALAKGKKKYDKRENIKKRETDREIRREYSARG